jgi:hypothetical protein
MDVVFDVLKPQRLYADVNQIITLVSTWGDPYRNIGKSIRVTGLALTWQPLPATGAGLPNSGIICVTLAFTGFGPESEYRRIGYNRSPERWAARELEGVIGPGYGDLVPVSSISDGGELRYDLIPATGACPARLFQAAYNSGQLFDMGPEAAQLCLRGDMTELTIDNVITRQRRRMKASAARNPISKAHQKRGGAGAGPHKGDKGQYRRHPKHRNNNH